MQFLCFFAYESERSWGQKEVVAGCCRVACDGLNSLMTCTIIYKNIDFFHKNHRQSFSKKGENQLLSCCEEWTGCGVQPSVGDRA